MKSFAKQLRGTVIFSNIFTKECYSSLPYDIISHLIKKEYYKTEGIFRISGNNNEVQDIIKLDKKRKPIDLSVYNCHTIASTLKQWLRELKEPLMTFEFYSSWICALDLSTKQLQSDALKKVIKTIPESNALLLKELYKLLSKIHKNRTTSKMPAKNLSVVFSPVLMWSNIETSNPIELVKEQENASKAICLLITEYIFIFMNANPPKTFQRSITVQQDKFLDSLAEGSVNTARTLLEKQQELSLTDMLLEAKNREEAAKKKQIVTNYNKNLTRSDSGSDSRNDNKKDNRLSNSTSIDMDKIPLPLKSSFTNVNYSPRGKPLSEDTKQRRRQLLQLKNTSSSFSDEVIVKARKRVKESSKLQKKQASIIFTNSTNNINDKSTNKSNTKPTIQEDKCNNYKNSKEDISEDIITISDKTEDITDTDSVVYDYSLSEDGSDSEDIINDILLGILCGNTIHVREYVSLLEAVECEELQQRLIELEKQFFINSSPNLLL